MQFIIHLIAIQRSLSHKTRAIAERQSLLCSHDIWKGGLKVRETECESVSHIIVISIGYCAQHYLFIYLFTFCWIIKLNRCAVIMNGDRFDYYWLLLATVRSRKEENFHPNEVRWNEKRCMRESSFTLTLCIGIVHWSIRPDIDFGYRVHWALKKILRCNPPKYRELDHTGASSLL